MGVRFRLGWLLSIVAPVLALLVVVVWIELKGPFPSGGKPLKGVLTSVDSTVIQLITDLSKLFISWSIALVGGVLYCFKVELEGKVNLSPIQVQTGLWSMIAAILSIFFGQMTISAQVFMLATDCYVPRDSLTSVYSTCQLFTFLASLALLLVLGGTLVGRQRLERQ